MIRYQKYSTDKFYSPQTKSYVIADHILSRYLDFIPVKVIQNGKDVTDAVLYKAAMMRMSRQGADLRVALKAVGADYK